MDTHVESSIESETEDPTPKRADPIVRALLVDDDPHLCRLIATDLREHGIGITWCTSAEAALEILTTSDVHVVVTDIAMRGMNGIELCRRIRELRPEIPVMIVTGHGNVEHAVGALRAGAFDFVVKPVDLDLLALTLERAARHRRLQEEVTRLRSAVATAHGFGELRYESRIMRDLGDLLARVAPSDAAVLVTGASGTGKELVARALHGASRRADGPFVALNCAAMPPALLESELFGHVRGAFTDAHAPRTGLFVQADGGTLFLDEIGDLSPALQPKLLRALQEGVVRPVGSDRTIACDVRVIAATNQDLEVAVAQGQFREDLFFRINVIHVDVPPLRARGRDVLLLAQLFLERYAEAAGRPMPMLTPEASERLLAYAWPGNVRELQNCMERAIALADGPTIDVADLPQRIQAPENQHALIDAGGSALLEPIAIIERRHILRVLDAVEGNRTTAARILGLDRKTLYRKLQQYDAE